MGKEEDSIIYSEPLEVTVDEAMQAKMQALLTSSPQDEVASQDTAKRVKKSKAQGPPGPDVVVVRKRVSEYRETLQQQERRTTLAKKLRGYDAGKVGGEWTKWINVSRSTGWKSIDPKVTSRWATFIQDASSLELDDRVGVIEAVVRGMGLDPDENFILEGVGSNIGSPSSKVAFFFALSTSEKRYHTSNYERRLIGDATVRKSISAGAFLMASFGVLSEYDGEQTEKMHRAVLVEKVEALGRTLGLRDICSGLADWIGRPEAREWNAQRVTPQRKPT